MVTEIISDSVNAQSPSSTIETSIAPTDFNILPPATHTAVETSTPFMNVCTTGPLLSVPQLEHSSKPSKPPITPVASRSAGVEPLPMMNACTSGWLSVVPQVEHCYSSVPFDVPPDHPNSILNQTPWTLLDSRTAGGQTPWPSLGSRPADVEQLLPTIQPIPVMNACASGWLSVVPQVEHCYSSVPSEVAPDHPNSILNQTPWTLLDSRTATS